MIYTNTNNNYKMIHGQAALEFACLIGLVVLALFAFSMHDYLKQAIQGKWKESITSTFGEEQYYGETKTDITVDLYLQETVNATGNYTT